MTGALIGMVLLVIVLPLLMCRLCFPPLTRYPFDFRLATANRPLLPEVIILPPPSQPVAAPEKQVVKMKTISLPDPLRETAYSKIKRNIARQKLQKLDRNDPIQRSILETVTRKKPLPPVTPPPEEKFEMPEQVPPGIYARRYEDRQVRRLYVLMDSAIYQSAYNLRDPEFHRRAWSVLGPPFEQETDFRRLRIAIMQIIHPDRADKIFTAKERDELAPSIIREIESVRKQKSMKRDSEEAAA